MTPSTEEHPFVRRPHRVMLGMSVPVLLSLVAEPLTGLIDTAFVRPLGAVSMTALGIGVTVLSIAAWLLNFLSISTQTEVARAAGAGDRKHAGEICGLALGLSLLCGSALALTIWLFGDALVAWMTEASAVQDDALLYLGIRLLGSPLLLVTMTALGALRGLQDMRTPLVIVAISHALNMVLDPLLIFGLGPVPALGLAGAAWASTASQWIATGLALIAVRTRLPLPRRLPWHATGRLFVTGRDLFLRTGLLTLFLIFSTQAATRAGVDTGAAHHAVRQVWIFTALALDAYAATAQSLVGFFLGGQRLDLARRAAGVASVWGVVTGVGIAVLMAIGTSAAAVLWVPPSAQAVFVAPWLIAAASQPLNALSFVTDGVHWGTGDYRFLRNGMIAATGTGMLLLWLLDPEAPHALLHIWLITAVWITIRAAFGVLRIWPGTHAAPLGSESWRRR